MMEESAFKTNCDTPLTTLRAFHLPLDLVRARTVPDHDPSVPCSEEAKLSFSPELPKGGAMFLRLLVILRRSHHLTHAIVAAFLLQRLFSLKTEESCQRLLS
jgi:hypothetical protein